MSSIDRRVVEMVFDNKAFQDGVQDTLASLEALSKGLELDGATTGLTDIQAAGENLDLSAIAGGVDHIARSFTALGAIGFTVLQNLTTSVMQYADRVSGLVLDPLVAGGKRRAQNIEQAKFQFRGLGVDVVKAMEDSLYAVQGTAYGLDEAAKAASQLSASQITLGDDMRAALRGISGVAAMTNSTYEATAQIFTRVAGQGRLMGNDLNSLASRGLNAAATLAEAFGKTEAQIREMVTEGKISFDMFSTAVNDAFGENATKANETYAGSLANMRAALARIGAGFFTPFLMQQRDLFNELTPAIDKVGAALKPVIEMMLGVTGDRNKGIVDFINGLPLDRLPELITPILGIITNLRAGLMGVIDTIKTAFTQIFPAESFDDIIAMISTIEDFTESIKMGAVGSENLRRTFAGVFALFSIGWTVIKEAATFLLELFGIVTEGSGAILEFTGNVGDFLVALDQAVKNGTGVTKFFDGLRDALVGPIRFVKSLGAALLSLFAFDPPTPGELTASFEPLGRLGQILIDIWDRVLDSWSRIREIFAPITDFLRTLFGSAVDAIMESLEDLDFDKILDIINTGLFASLLAVFKSFSDNLGTGMGSAIHRLTTPIARLTWALNTMQTTLRALTLLQIAAAVGVLSASIIALSKVDGPGLAKAMGAMSVMMGQLVATAQGLSMVGGVTGLTGMGAGLILIAIALRILTSSVKELSELETEGLAKGLIGVTVLLAALVLVVSEMEDKTEGMIKAGVGLMLIAVAIKILVSAVSDFSDLSWEEIGKGLTGVAGLLTALMLFTKFADTDGAGVSQGAGLLLLAVGIRILVDAVSEFSKMSWEEIGKGLATITAILAAFAIFSRAVDPAGLVRTGVALVLVGAAMKILASALNDFAGMSYEDIGKGLGVLAGALGIIALALNAMPASTLISAASLVVVAGALLIISKALDAFAGMTPEEIALGLGVLAGALGIIALAVNAMSGALLGAAAIVVVAGAIALLVPSLLLLGSMSWEQIAKGLGTLALAFTIFGVAGLVLTPVVPTLLALAGAIALAGLGIFAFAVGLGAIAAAGAGATAALVGIILALVSLIPDIAIALGNAFVVMIKIIGEAAPELYAAGTKIFMGLLKALEVLGPELIDTFLGVLLKLLESLRDIFPDILSAFYDLLIGVLEVITEKAPEVITAFANLVITVLEGLTEHAPAFVTAAYDLLVAFLGGVADNLDKAITAGTDILIALIEGIADNSVRIVEVAFAAILTFIEGVTDAIEKYAPELRAAGAKLAVAIGDGMTGGLVTKGADVVRAGVDLAGNLLSSVGGFLGVSSPSKEFMKIGAWSAEGLALGLVGGKEQIAAAWKTTADLLADAVNSSAKTIDKLTNEMDRLADAQERDIRAIYKAERALMNTRGKKDQADKVEDLNYKLRDLNESYNENLIAMRENDAATTEARLEYIKSKSALTELNVGLADEHTELLKLGTAYDNYVGRLDDANGKLEDAIRIRDAYQSSIANSFDDLPGLDQDSDLDGYINQLGYANENLKKFSETLMKLRAKGLSDELYAEFLSKGPDILPFLEELRAGGERSIWIVNKLTADLNDASDILGETVSVELYQAGVDAAQGLVDGLTSKQVAVEAAMSAMAKSIIKVLELQLQIQSPSRVMKKLGAFTAQGFADGLSGSQSVVDKAVKGLGNSTVDAMKKSIVDIQKMIDMDGDITPVITPIIDLSEIRKGAKLVSSEFGGVSVASSYSGASMAYSGYQENRSANDLVGTAAVASGNNVVNFTQNNQSPKALSSAEIYRQTKNQLSKTKGALTNDT
jgi:tape measure domain-containing protein